MAQQIQITGVPTNIVISSITMLAPGTAPSAQMSGASPNLSLALSIPFPAVTTFTAGSIAVLAPGAEPTFTINGSAPSYTLNLGLPAGPTGQVGANNGLVIGGAAAIAAQGAYVQWNRLGGDGGAWIVNQRGEGAGGTFIGESDTSNNFTESAFIAPAGGVSRLDSSSLQVGPSSTTNVSIELGSQTTAAGAFLDLHSSGAANDYDARVVATGGVAGTIGAGTLNFLAAAVQFNGLALVSVGLTTALYKQGMNEWQAGSVSQMFLSGVVDVDPGVNSNIVWYATYAGKQMDALFTSFATMSSTPNPAGQAGLGLNAAQAAAAIVQIRANALALAPNF